MSVATVVTNRGEAEGMIRWSLMFALAREAQSLIILRSESVSEKEVRSHLQSWADRFPTVAEISIRSVGATVEEDALRDVIHECDPSLLVLGQNRCEESAEDDLRVLRKVFDHALCDSIILRLGNRRIDESDQILVPTAGGPHSEIALGLASQMAKRYNGEIVPLFVESEIGEEDGQAVGMRILNKVIDRAGLDRGDREHVKPQIVVCNGVGKGIARAACERPYDLVLVGASHSMIVKKKLFGMFPSAMFECEDGMTVALIRRRRPVGHRIRHRLERFLALRIPQLAREDRVALFERLQTQSVWSFDFVVLILLSTGIASLGLIQSSPAVVIGAMLVAPLMTPLLGSGMSLIQGNLPMMLDCIKSIVLGFFAALLFGTLVGLVAPISALTHELAARGAPNLLDFGVATLSGIAASHCVARPALSSALAGVAIAAALVPPIATVGISIALREWSNATGAALLFGTNVVAIILASAVTFFAMGIRGQVGAKSLWARRTLVLLAAALAVLLVPLSTVLVSKAGKAAGEKILAENQQKRIAAIVATVLKKNGIKPGKIEITQITAKGQSLNFTCRIETPLPISPPVVNEIVGETRSQLKMKTVNTKILSELVIVE